MKINILDTVKIEISWKEIINFLISIMKWIKKLLKKYKDPVKQSLINDIISIFDDFCKDLQSFLPWNISNESKILLWMSKNNNLEMSFHNLFAIIGNSSNPFLVWIDNYKESGKYKDLFSNCFLKLSAYWSILKLAFENYWINNYSKELKRERKILKEFITKNIIDLTKSYVDFMVSTYYPSLSEDEKNFIVKKLYRKQNFKQYFPIIKKFLNKLEKRICM